MPLAVDKYLIVAHQRGLLEIDGKALILTDAGKRELNTISYECLDLLKDILGDEVEKAGESLTAVHGRKFSPAETFQYVFMALTGTEARLLAFLLNEKETNYETINKVLKQDKGGIPVDPNPPTGNNVTPFKKKPKYDA